MTKPGDQEEARRQLLALMEHLSETYWCAGWLDGLEHQLWRMAHGGPSGSASPQCVPTEQELSQLQELSQRAGGWWCWPDEEANVKFLSLEEWERIYEVERPVRVFEVRREDLIHCVEGFDSTRHGAGREEAS